MKRISLLLLLCIFVLMGCSTSPTVVYKTEYQEVKIPVVYELKRPNRPIYESNDSVPVYLLKLIEYTQVLETIIDEHNEKEITL